jgi:hypothetical protein
MHRLVFVFAALAITAPAATLQKMSLDEMIVQSTDIVRGKVMASSASFRGTPGRAGMIYTHYTVTVSERLKGSSSATKVDIAVPGGVAAGYRQVFTGAPTLNSGDEFVFFLWTSRSGLTQVIGLTQGLFSLNAVTSGKAMLSRSAAGEVMLDASGKPMTDSGESLSLDDLRQRVASVLGAGKVQQ